MIPLVNPTYIAHLGLSKNVLIYLKFESVCEVTDSRGVWVAVCSAPIHILNHCGVTVSTTVCVHAMCS